MRRSNPWKLIAMTGAILALAGMRTAVRAQDADDLKRGVARISLMNGDVNVRRGDSGDWVAGVINAPLMTDDRIATGPASRTEIEFDASNAIRLGANAELHLTQLEYARYQMELGHGLATFRMLRQNDVNVEIDTPSLSIRPSRQGSVRVVVNDAGETEVTARGGDVEVFTPRGTQWIRSGQMMMARGSASDPEFQILSAGAPDDWDRWSDSRDRAALQSNSNRYVGPGIYGAEELDNYGQWQSVPEYGYVWQPSVAPDWTPYYNGRWSWADWYGWTWISSDPWGWAPYHYGRWFRDPRFGWCWYPGVMTARHYWSPALVGFVGFGGGGGLGFGFGNVGWVPLAPYEVYHPWWGRAWYRSGGYFNHQVNITNVNIGSVYRNARFNAVSSVAYNDFNSGRFNHVSRFNGSQIHDAGLIRGATPFSPGSQHLRYSDRNVANVPRFNEAGRFFRSQTPNPAARVSFQQQVGRGAVANPVGSTLGGPRNVQGAPSTGAQSAWRRFGQTPSTPQSSPQTNRGGFGGMGQSRQQLAPESRPSQTPQAASRQDNRGNGWQRFGSTGSGSPAPQQNTPRSIDRNVDRGGRTFGNGSQQSPARQEYMNSPRGFGGGGNRQESLRIAPPVVRERPSYNAPRQSAPSYSAPRQSAPRQSAPSYSAPRNGGGGGGSAPRGNSGGSRSSGGGGGHRGR